MLSINIIITLSFKSTWRGIQERSYTPLFLILSINVDPFFEDLLRQGFMHHCCYQFHDIYFISIEILFQVGILQ